MEEVNSLIFEQLHAIRYTLDAHTREIHELGNRMEALEQQMMTLQSQLPSMWGHIAGVKRRVELVEPPSR